MIFHDRSVIIAHLGSFCIGKHDRSKYLCHDLVGVMTGQTGTDSRAVEFDLCKSSRLVKLKLNFRQYPTIHTNYS